MIPSPLVSLPRWVPAVDSLRLGERAVAEETAVAFVINGCPHAVMMATPAHLDDLALGFALAEGIVGAAEDLESLKVASGELGIELRLRVRRGQPNGRSERRRRVTGSVGCGLCGVASLAEAVRPPPRVDDGGLRLTPKDIAAAMAALGEGQELNRHARALHGAAFWQPHAGVVALREDVGRHNALDKLAGVLARRGVPGASGAVLLTSRVSVEMVQKAARLGSPVLMAVSAPTALAVRTAEGCGITLVAVARGEAFEVYTHAERISAIPIAALGPIPTAPAFA